jgi:hypothetical protein
MSRVGVIGLGNAGKRHSANLLALGHEVIGYDPRVTKELLTRQEFWEMPLHAVVVATPPSTHYTEALTAIRHGTHVFVEKPLADNFKDACAMVMAAQEAGVRLQCGYQFRHMPSVIKASLELDALSDVRFVQVLAADMAGWKPSTYARDMLLEYSHELDLLDLWSRGRITAVYAKQMSEGYLIIDVSGNRFSGMVHLANEKTAAVRARRFDALPRINWTFDVEENERAYQAELREFLNPQCPPDTGLGAMQLIDVVQRSLAGEGWVSLA